MKHARKNMVKSISMPDIFSQHNMSIALHIPSQTDVIIKRCVWVKNELYYECLIPQKVHKDEWELCGATYTAKELDFFNRATNGVKIEIEQIKIKK